MKQKKKSSVFFLITELLCAVVILYSAARLVMICQDYHQTEKEYADLSSMAVTELPAAEKSDKTEFYIDLEAVKAKNPDATGWIILPDSRINYPIVKSADNQDYLRTSFEGEAATAGTLFTDMNCSADYSDYNTIIYGHNMKNGSMFRALNDLTDQEFFDQHRMFLISTGGDLEEYEIISCYETTADAEEPWQISFESDAAYEEWLKNITAKCNYQCMPYATEKNTITLSTCRGKSGGTGRFVVHLQKKQISWQ